MTKNPSRTTKAGGWATFAYALVGALALGFDLLTDQSFGATMLAVLPISLIALACLVVGPWLESERKSAVLRAWFIGVLLVLGISIAFSARGTEQAKAGELVFTYAAMIMALPGSLILPVTVTWLEPLLGGYIFMRIFSMWVICTVVGYVEWKTLEWLHVIISTRVHKRSSGAN